MLKLNYTSLKHSQELVKYGLDPKTADAHYYAEHLSPNVPYIECTNPSIKPAWSVESLIRNLPIIQGHGPTIQVTYTGEFFIRYYQEPKYINGPLIYCESDIKKTLLGAIVDMFRVLYKIHIL